MMSLTVDFNADDAIKAMQLAPGRTERATVRALNRALTSGRAEMARRVAKGMGMKVGDAKEAIFTRQASAGKLSVSLVASKKRRPLYDFKAKQTGRGVSFVGAGGARQVVPGAFMTGVQTGHAGSAHSGVFMRRGKARLPIRELYGVSIGHVFEQHREAVTQVMREVFEKNLAHELEFANTERG
jgi:hypothetical protein